MIINDKVSVPSRGNGVIDFMRTISPLTWETFLLFPSPLGEMGLSITTTSTNARVAGSFRPLSGKWGYRYYRCRV